MILVSTDEPQKHLHGWLCFLNHDGNWVTLRLATDDDKSRIKDAVCYGRTARRRDEDDEPVSREPDFFEQQRIDRYGR